MKVLFNIMTTISFLGVVSIAAGGAYVYVNKDGIVDNIKSQITEAALGGVTDALPPGTLPGVGGGGGGFTGLPVPNPVVPF